LGSTDRVGADGGTFAYSEEELEQRIPLQMNITSITPNGQVSISFSEKFNSLDDFSAMGLNLTIFNMLKDDIFELRYNCFVEVDDSQET